jgi:hypothetical protein
LATESPISDLICRAASALRCAKRAHFAGHHGKPAALFAGACGFHRGVQRQDIGLEGNAVDHAGDLGDAVAGGLDLAHGLHHLFDHFTAAHGCGAGALGQLAGLACVVGAGAHGAGELFHRSRGLLQAGGLLFGAAGQIQVALAICALAVATLSTPLRTLPTTCTSELRMACIEAITLPAGPASRPSSARLPWAMRPATSANSAGSAPSARVRLRVIENPIPTPARTARPTISPLARLMLRERACADLYSSAAT